MGGEVKREKGREKWCNYNIIIIINNNNYKNLVNRLTDRNRESAICLSLLLFYVTVTNGPRSQKCNKLKVLLLQKFL